MRAKINRLSISSWGTSMRRWPDATARGSMIAGSVLLLSTSVLGFSALIQTAETRVTALLRTVNQLGKATARPLEQAWKMAPEALRASVPLKATCGQRCGYSPAKMLQWVWRLTPDVQTTSDSGAVLPGTLAADQSRISANQIARSQRRRGPGLSDDRPDVDERACP